MTDETNPAEQADVAPLETTEEEAQESTPEETGSEDSTEQTSEDEASKESNEDDSTADKPKKNGLDKRFSQLTAQKRELQLEAEFWKNKAMGTAQAEKPQVQVSHAKPTFEQYGNVLDFTEALTDWKVNESNQRQAQAAHQNVVARQYDEREKQFHAKTPDYKELIESVSHVPVHTDIVYALAESEVGPQVKYYLANHVEEIERLNSLSPAARLRAIGKIEAKFEAPASAKPQVQVKKVSAAPSPVRPVNTSNSSTVTEDELSSAEWINARNKARKGR